MLFFLSYSFGTKTTNQTSYTPVAPSISYPAIPDKNRPSPHPFSDRNGTEPQPFGAAHTYMANISGKALPCLCHNAIEVIGVQY